MTSVVRRETEIPAPVVVITSCASYKSMWISRPANFPIVMAKTSPPMPAPQIATRNLEVGDENNIGGALAALACYMPSNHATPVTPVLKLSPGSSCTIWVKEVLLASLRYGVNIKQETLYFELHPDCLHRVMYTSGSCLKYIMTVVSLSFLDVRNGG